jgi:hypothetical protein
MQMIIKATDRSQIFKQRSGLFEVCVFGYMDSSVAIKPVEVNTGGRFTAIDGTAHTFLLANKTYMYFTYTSD